MSPRRQNDKKDIQDSTTDFFLKVIQKEKEKNAKENTSKDNLLMKHTKTMDSVGHLYNYVNQTFDRILSSKMSIMILSFCMAAILFITISGDDILTSPTSGTTLDNVPLQITGLDDDLELTGAPDKVEVVLIGPSFDIFKMNLTKNYEISLDVTNLGEGEHEVKLKHNNFPSTLTVVTVPDNLKIKLSPKETVSYELGTKFINEDQLDTKYSVSVEEMAIQKVEVRASQETLKKIDKVVACIDVSKKTESFEQEAIIKALDAQGKEMNVDIMPTTVHVKCDVASYSKNVPIVLNYIGNPAVGYQVSSYTLSQNEVTIYGLESKIKDIQSVQVDVNINDLKSNKTFDNVMIKKVTGINKLSLESIDISVDVEKVITQKFDKIPIKVLNNSKNYKVSFAGEGQYATVAITGSVTKVSSLTADNIQASVDIDGLKVGTRRVDVKAVVDDEKLQIELLSSSKVSINIERN